jgi:hypothetical protein
VLRERKEGLSFVSGAIWGLLQGRDSTAGKHIKKKKKKVGANDMQVALLCAETSTAGRLDHSTATVEFVSSPHLGKLGIWRRTLVEAQRPRLLSILMLTETAIES